MRPLLLPCLRVPVAFGWLVGAGAATAAGGHFDVDDASILAPGHCQLELWAGRGPRADVTGLHLGPSCRVGAFELGLDLDRIATADTAGNALGPHLKWVRSIGEGVAVGAVVGTAFDLRRGGHPVQALYLPASWAVADGWMLNMNLGWDRGDEGVSHRIGASAEWSPNEATTLIGERVRTGGALVSRLGVRFVLGTGLSLDLSVARAGPFAGRLYTIGLNRDVER